jgi:hypothetical protein
MKCLACKEGTLKLAKYEVKKKAAYYPPTKKGILQCDKCGHREVF